MKALRPADLLSPAESSFDFYSLLPSDAVALSLEWPKLALKAIGERLELSGAVEAGDANALDALTLALMAHGASVLPEGPDWNALARRLSHLYARNLKSDGVRGLRMKAARANYFLRDLIDFGRLETDGVLSERRYAQGFVWDWLPWQDGEILADSGDKNVVYNQVDGSRQALRLGLPTQIDCLQAGRLAVTSCYSDGWFSWSPGAGAMLHEHNRPVVLAFDFGEESFFLDRDGILYRAGQSLPVVKIPVDAVWRARLVGSTVFVSDWSTPGYLTMLEMEGLRVSQVDCAPVLLTNDICMVGDTYYVIDKMQGRVFAFDTNFSLRSARLSFGKGRGRLYDPITLRAHDGKLFVLSWLTGALASIGLF